MVNIQLPPDSSNTAAVILAGGQSRRMGQHKALLPLADKPLISHLAEQLSTHLNKVWIAGTPESALYEFLGLPVIADNMLDAGPLAGVSASLHYAQQLHLAEWLLFVPCDGLGLPVNFFQRMQQLAEEQKADVIYARDSEREHYLYLLAHVRVQPGLQAYLAKGGRKVLDWLHSQAYAAADFSDNEFRFHNVNTPQDWQQLLNQHLNRNVENN